MRARGLKHGLAVLLAPLVVACTTGGLKVADSTVAEETAFLWLTSVSFGKKANFGPDDEKVTLRVRFSRNLIGFYVPFRVDWIQPDGHIYWTHRVRTQWGSHQELITSMAIRSKPPAKLPGIWEVKLYHGSRLMEARKFVISKTDEEGQRLLLAMKAHCPPIDQPAGPCIDRAAEE